MKTEKQQAYHQKRCKYCKGTGRDIFDKTKPCINCSKEPVILKQKNECAKRVEINNAYEIWTSKDNQWMWYVLKKYQKDDNKLYARWHCFVTSPLVPYGEYGDEYVENIKKEAVRIK